MTVGPINLGLIAMISILCVQGTTLTSQRQSIHMWPVHQIRWQIMIYFERKMKGHLHTHIKLEIILWKNQNSIVNVVLLSLKTLSRTSLFRIPSPLCRNDSCHVKKDNCGTLSLRQIQSVLTMNESLWASGLPSRTEWRAEQGYASWSEWPWSYHLACFLSAWPSPRWPVESTYNARPFIFPTGQVGNGG